MNTIICTVPVETMEKQESKNTTMVAAEGIFFITFSYKEQLLSSIEVISCQSTVTSHSLCVCATVHVCVCACTALKGSDPRGLTVSQIKSKASKANVTLRKQRVRQV